MTAESCPTRNEVQYSARAGDKNFPLQWHLAVLTSASGVSSCF